MMRNKKLSRFFAALMNVFEVYLPSAMLLVMLAAFVLGIIYRYLLRDPLSWSYELQSVCFLVVSILACGSAHRNNDHVVFDMLYEKASPKTQCIMRLLSNGLIAVFSCVLIPATALYLLELDGITTPVMDIPLGVVFSSFLIYFIFAVIHAVEQLAADISVLRGAKKRQEPDEEKGGEEA